jgi:hypothetical protein
LFKTPKFRIYKKKELLLRKRLKPGSDLSEKGSLDRLLDRRASEEVRSYRSSGVAE